MRKPVDKALHQYANLIVLPNQFYFIANHYTRQIELISENVEVITGYTPSEVNYDLFVDFIHPEDRRQVETIIRVSFEYFKLNKVNPNEGYILVEHRCQKKDGNVIHTRRHATATSIDEKHRIIKSLTIFTDISSLEPSDEVVFAFKHKKKNIINLNDLKLNVKKAFNEKELNLIKLMSIGLDSTQMASEMGMKKEEVIKLEQSMFEKTGLNSPFELVLFSIQNNLIPV